MTVVSSLPQSKSAELDSKIILNIFSSIGRCRFLDEKHFDACTALSGSGPAFACIFLEAMADGGVMMGLPRAEALELAAQSELFALYFDLNVNFCHTALQGAARMTLQGNTHPAQLKDAVTSVYHTSVPFCCLLIVVACSPWRMHHRRSPRSRGRTRPFHNRACNPDRDRACQRARPTTQNLKVSLDITLGRNVVGICREYLVLKECTVHGGCHRQICSTSLIEERVAKVAGSAPTEGAHILLALIK